MQGGRFRNGSAIILLLHLHLAVEPGAFAQGLVLFNNRVAGVVDARVSFIRSGPNDGQGVGAGYTAQLFGGPEGTPISNLTPLFPTTTFRTSSAAAQGYVNPVVVEIPGVGPGNRAALLMRVYPTGFEPNCASGPYGESNLITIITGGDILPPANLEGLQSFSFFECPEPSTLTFAAAALVGGLFFVKAMKS